MRYELRGFGITIFLSLLLSVWPRIAFAQQPSEGQDKAPASTVHEQPPEAAAGEDTDAIQPFGANLFAGTYQAQHQDGRNADYRLMPGDRVAVNTWGAVEINQVFVVDGQGNIFLPGIGPVVLEGVRNADLTKQVQAQINRIYRGGNVGVYTNLLTAAPVGVYVTGGVLRPGRYAGVPADSVLFFINQAGGIDPRMGSYRSIQVIREDKTIATVDLYEFILHGKMPRVQFVDGDTVLVERRGPAVLVRGGVAAPALIEFHEDQSTGAEALAIVPKAARATTVTVQGVRGDVGFSKTMPLEAFRTMQLRDGDTVHLRIEGRPETIIVQLEGEFKGPSLLSVARGSRLLDVLNYVEVDLDLADVSSVHMRRESVAAAQKQTIEDGLHRLERSTLLATSTTEKEAAIRVREAELVQSFVKTARNIQPLGRVVTASDGRQLNVLLKDGDTIVIPSKTNVVRVGGEVHMNQAVVYTPGKTAGDYVAMAGGFTNRSDDDRIIVMHASAEVDIGDEDAPIRPGDEILVAPKVDTKILQNAADLTQVIYQIAVAAAVVVAL